MFPERSYKLKTIDASLEIVLFADEYEKYLSILHEDLKLSTENEILEANDSIVRAVFLYPGQIETLKAIHDQGPLFDGDVPSKTARDFLLSTGLVTKIVVKGEQGFNACTYKGSKVLKLVNVMLSDVSIKRK
jgi:hypothetical protein